ncbi:hypothetical protein O6H91_05G005700 [Diphasiastrum complanatum]|uniref:Uncharacterized protein n=1 Tax=Diphasiastrum complanatum TaxID=34168 RepID=A0ACC2DKG0_DIPCM|nr:hypothetical protein O6H91_05G005700 [Diphasiastrum complanatum]
MEIYARNLGNMQQLAAISTLENRAETNERRWFRSGYHVEGSDEEVICPKPRRVAHVAYPIPDVLKVPRRSRSHSVTRADADAGFEILNIFFNKSGLGESPISGCSPPYFCGSPPSRSSNPLVHDVEFVHQRFTPSPSVLSQTNSCEASSRGGKPLVRVEGFTFSGADSRCSVSAQA